MRTPRAPLATWNPRKTTEIPGTGRARKRPAMTGKTTDGPVAAKPTGADRIGAGRTGLGPAFETAACPAAGHPTSDHPAPTPRLPATAMFATAVAIIAALGLAPGCAMPAEEHSQQGLAGIGAEGDPFAARRTVSAILTDPFCDVCNDGHKVALRERSPIIAAVVEAIDLAEGTIDVAQFTFSVVEIRDALVRAASERGVRVRVAIDAGQRWGETLAKELDALPIANLEVRFIAGRTISPDRTGLLHSKFMIVDGRTLVTGSNNWSSTGTTINEENTFVINSTPDDPLLVAFTCHFEAIYAGDTVGDGACNSDAAAFTPSTAAIRLIRDGIRDAKSHIDVLMHHLTFTDLVKELAKAAERSVRVRIIANAADRGEHQGAAWDRLRAAGAELRYKQTNAALSQYMHDKLAIIDDRVLINGSGNWSGGAFFDNFENFVRYEDPRLTTPLRRTFARLWRVSLRADSLDRGIDAAIQDRELRRPFFGNLHAHVHAEADDGKLLDDGRSERRDEAGIPIPVATGESTSAAASFAFTYARDRGGLDFMAITPHCADDADGIPDSEPNMSASAFAELEAAAAAVNAESGGNFLAVAGMEWSTNGSGNHVNIFGSTELAKVERGRFDLLYNDYLPRRAMAFETPLVMLNHPRTFREHEDTLRGNWDQVFDVLLTEIPSAGQRADKFNDYGIDDFPPLRDVHARWIAGEEMPDRNIVNASLAALWQASAPYARLMEVTVARGTEIGHESSQNPSLTVAEDGTAERFTRVHSNWDYFLLHGFRLAPTASHDNHLANWGTGHSSRTGMHAEALDAETLLEAIDQRSVFASEDENLDIRLHADGHVAMGGMLATSALEVSATLALTDPDFPGPFRVAIYRGRIGGEEVTRVEELEVDGDGATDFSVALPEPGEYFFYVEVHELAAERMAWSAPIWVERLAP